MQINENEIKCNVLHAADQKAQIEIEAQLNATTPEHIREILRGQGVDLRSLKGAVKKHIAEPKERRKPVQKKIEFTGVVVSAVSALNSRVRELNEQKKLIEDELKAIKRELRRIDRTIEGSDIE